MFPVPSLAEQLEQDWATELAERFGVSADQFRANPTRVMDYPAGTLRIELMDGSFVEFQRAFHIHSAAKKTIAVFTEHCGHHIYPHHEARVIRDGKLVTAIEHA
jgi:hypothetical protein